MSKYAELKIDDKIYKLPIVIGTENEKAVDITRFRKESGYTTLDPALGNTGACKSSITYIDGEKGILRYRGFPIEELAEKATFVETIYLLLHGELPNIKDLDNFSSLLNRYSLLHEDMRHFFDGFPATAHPMSILATMVNSLSSFYPNVDALSMKEDINKTATRIISLIRTIAAFSYKKSIGEPLVYPRKDLSFCANFLNMMFSSPVRAYEIDPVVIKALGNLWTVHADHEQNCSTTTVRVIGSAQVDLYASISAGISALSGPLHGGANQAVMKMLRKIQYSGGNLDRVIEKAKDKNDPFRLMGVGHRVYKNFDPRAKIIKKACHDVLNKLGIHDKLLDIAMELEERVLSDDYFVSRYLYPNVDFYSGIIYKAIGIPENMFTVMFAVGRLPGWIAHWSEMVQAPDRRISRPRQIYTGKTKQNYVNIVDRT